MNRCNRTAARRGHFSGHIFAVSVVFIVAAFLGALTTGCSKPNKANIELRRQNADLRSQIENLQRQHQADVASIRATQPGATTAPALPEQRIEQLFTVHGLQFGRLTGADPDRAGLKAYVVPTDNAGDPIKAAGSFVVDVFNLSAKENNRVGHWEFPLEAAAKNWFGKAMLYTYALPLPMDQPPSGDLTIRVTFTDALTGREFSAQKELHLK